MSDKQGKTWKIGLVVFVAVVLLVLGLNFLIGKRLFSSENNYYTYYNNVQGLQESAAVKVSGFTVGRVSDIELQPDRRVKVSFTTNKNLKIPKGSFAKLAAADLISGTKIIELKLTDSTVYYPDGSLVPPEKYAGVLSNISENVSPMLTSVQHAVVSLDTLIGSINQVFNGPTRQHLNNSLASLDKTMKHLSDLSRTLDEQSAALAGILKNTNSVTANLADNNKNITQTLGNLNTVSSKLAATNIDQIAKNLQAVSTNLKNITEKINNNQGSLGMLLNDKTFYNNMTKTLSSLDAVLADLKKHPARYINLSVLGRKAK